MKNSAKDVTSELNKFIGKKIIDLATGLVDNLVESTPRLTGYAESNWLVQEKNPVTLPKGSKIAVESAAPKEALAVLKDVYEVPDLVFISNPVDYIGLLNVGSSAKAPAGFVQTAIAKAIKNTV